ncbi:MAG: FtsX-like permease family protein [Gemmatimonadaceae bacterium]|nr:FtsX-like permease family protein [Gemmatimonadaceae bacterium]
MSIRVHSVFEGVRIALDAIRSNKVRAGLTILGISVGVFVVTVMSAAVHGINSGVAKSIAAAGPTTFFLTRWPPEINNCNGSADSCPWRHNTPLTLEQGKELEKLPTIKLVVSHIGSQTSAKYGDRELPGVSLDAYTRGWADISGADIIEGRDFTAEEDENAARVVLVNEKVADRLFAGGTAVGKTIRLKGDPFLVIGVYKPLANAFDSGDRGKIVMPYVTAVRRMNVWYDWMDLTVKPREGVARDAAMDEVIATLRTLRHLRPAQQNNFFTSTPEKLMQLYDKIVGMFFLVMITLSAIGLLVGGVGVIAIMMISVTERTREIGVRMALGATRGTILWQFLVEAATLTSIGALSGLALGAAVTWLLRHATPIDAVTPPLAMVFAVGGSALAGIIFGLVPAARAARLDPVAALRYE